MNIEREIENIIVQREKKFENIIKDKNSWNKLQTSFDDLVREVMDIDSEDIHLEPLKSLFDEDTIKNFNEDFRSLYEKIDFLVERFGRKTIKLGVTGASGAGKSTLLQTISGLESDALPTSDGGPVTAVQSRIFHHPTKKEARITFHTFKSFREEVLVPYHNALKISIAPTNESEFENFNYNEELEKVNDTYPELVQKMRGIHGSYSSYKDNLNRQDLKIHDDFSQLREYVAYPSIDEEAKHKDKCPRPYLAVRKIRIDCPFPHNDVQNIGLIDLPGLGENTANAEKHQDLAIKEGVDIVLFVRRANSRRDFWGKADTKTLQIVKAAQDELIEESKLVHLVFNTRGVDSDDSVSDKATNNLVQDFVNARKDSVLNYYRLDVKNKNDVTNKLLQPVLDFLGKNLQEMDTLVHNATLATSDELKQKIDSFCCNVDDILKDLSSKVIPEELERNDCRKKLFKLIAIDFKNLLDRYSTDNPPESQSEEMLSKIQEQTEVIYAWINNGFGMTPDVWVKECEGSRAINRTSTKFIIDQCNQIRVAISKRYKELDVTLENILDDLYNKVADILKKHLGHSLGEYKHGKEYLSSLRNALVNGNPQALEIADTISEFLSVNLNYQQQIYPHIRNVLNKLTPDGDWTKIAKKMGEENFTEIELMKQLQIEIESKVYEIQRHIESQAKLPGLVIMSALEHFEDRLIRSDESEAQFHRLCLAYAKEIWPDKFGSPKVPTQVYIRINRILDNIKTYTN